MELTSQVINEAEFSMAKKGYDPDQVDEFLEKVAVAVDQQATALAEARSRSEAAEQRAVAAENRAEAAEKRLHDRPDTVGNATLAIPAVVAAPVAVPAAESEARSKAIAESAERELQTLQRTLLQAQKTADATVRDAQLEARAMIAAAEHEAKSAHENTKNRVLAEISRQDGRRESLRSEVVALERHLDEQRVRLRGSIESLQRILDDASRLKSAALPPVAPTEISGEPAPAQLAAPAQLPEPVTTEPVPERANLEPPSSGFVVAEDIAPTDSWSTQTTATPESSSWPEFDATERRDVGPPTQPLRLRGDVRQAGDAVESDESRPAENQAPGEEDSYLTELRKAMISDNSPTEPDDGWRGRGPSGRRR